MVTEWSAPLGLLVLLTRPRSGGGQHGGVACLTALILPTARPPALLSNGSTGRAY
jgi:hypothetical protein